jgi:valyl-tRNA synthetase
VTEAFVSLHEKGLVYQGEYMVNWSPALGTALSDLEVSYTEEEGTLYYFKYRLAGSEGHLAVATTRPETILGDTAVCVHPDDERYAHLVGKTVLVPMMGREIPIIADSYVSMEFGSGALKITPAHDVNDYAIGKRHSLASISILNKDATINSNGGAYEGLDRYECRERLWKDMERAGLAIKAEPHVQRVPRSERSGEVVEPMVSNQWFISMEGMAAKGTAAVRSGDITILPDRFEKVYFNWLDNIQDWCVSRQLWWGHRIPVWYVVYLPCTFPVPSLYLRIPVWYVAGARRSSAKLGEV